MVLLLLGAAVLLGGGRGGFGDVLVQLLAVALMLAQIASRRPAVRMPAPLLIVLVLALALPLLHMLPLPVDAWPRGGLRQQIRLDLQVAAATVDAHLSLDPLAAERALWSLLPALAMGVAVARLGHAQRRLLTIVLLALAILSILLGMAQLADGQQSLLRFHSPTSTLDAVGFFANRNHLASLLVACLPFAIGAAAWAYQRRAQESTSELLGIVGLIGVALLLVLGIALARSRAGLALGMLALLLCLPILWRLRAHRRVGRTLLLALLAALVLSVPFALFGLLQRLQTDVLDDGRWGYARVVNVAAHASAPLGSGLGTFAQVYPQYEADTGVGPDYAVVNHAHNDVLELWLEAGRPFIAAFAVFIVALTWMGMRLWRPVASLPAESLLLARLAWVSTLLLVLHSGLDYPLRTTAMMTVFAMLLALSVPALRGRTHRLASPTTEVRSQQKRVKDPTRDDSSVAPITAIAGESI